MPRNPCRIACLVPLRTDPHQYSKRGPDHSEVFFPKNCLSGVGTPVAKTRPGCDSQLIGGKCAECGIERAPAWAHHQRIRNNAEGKFLLLVAGPTFRGDSRVEALETLFTVASLRVWSHACMDIRNARELLPRLSPQSSSDQEPETVRRPDP